MSRDADKHQAPPTPDMTILDIVSSCRETEAVFRKYDRLAGTCLCCHALFDSLRDVCSQYSLDMNGLLQDLETVITSRPSDQKKTEHTKTCSPINHHGQQPKERTKP